MATAKKNKRLLEAEALLDNPNIKLFQELISRAEATTEHGYRTSFGGSRLESLADHPRVRHRFKQTNGKWEETTAAGKYQMVEGTWDGLAKRLGISGFSERNQDLAVIDLFKEHKVIDDIVNGDFDKAAGKLGTQFASLPSSKYPQKKRDENWLAKNIADIQGKNAAAILAQTDPEFVANVTQAATNAASGDTDALATLAAIQNAKSVGEANTLASQVTNPFQPLVDTAAMEAAAPLDFGAIPGVENQAMLTALANLSTLNPEAQSLGAVESVQSMATEPVEVGSAVPPELLAQVITDDNDLNRQAAINSMFRRDAPPNPLVELPGSIEAMITNFLEKSV